MKWQAVGASTRGTSHRRVDLPCQDAHEVRILSDARLLAAVADGLGSASHSEQGAKMAVQAALDSLEQSLSVKSTSRPEEWEAILKTAFSHAARKLQEIAVETGLALREYGTTLMVVVVQNDWLAVAHLGDGAAVAMLSNSQMKTISAPQRGEYANEVTPLTGPNAVDLVRLAIHQSEIEALVLLTDGLQNLCIQSQTGEPYTQFFAPFFDAIKKPLDIGETSKQLTEFLDSERICSKTDDDKTLVVLGKIQSESDPKV